MYDIDIGDLIFKIALIAVVLPIMRLCIGSSPYNRPPLYVAVAAVLLVFGFFPSVLFLSALTLAFLGPKLKNSPWLYVTAFGLMSCIGILAIKPKFDLRERSIENKYIGRVASNEYLSKKANPQSPDTKPAQSENLPKQPTPSNGPNYILPPDQNGKTVDFLIVICGLATVVGAGMLIYTVQHQQLTSQTAEQTLS